MCGVGLCSDPRTTLSTRLSRFNYSVLKQTDRQFQLGHEPTHPGTHTSQTHNGPERADPRCEVCLCVVPRPVTVTFSHTPAVFITVTTLHTAF